jgi:hypothetical protein
MIQPHPSLRQFIAPSYIDAIVEREGYEKFVPYTFITHLAYAYSQWIMTGSARNCINEPSVYAKEFYNLLEQINFESVDTGNPITFAIRVLRIIDKRVNLRQLELSATNGSRFDINNQVIYQNYKFDLHDLSTIQLKTLGIGENENLDTLELCKDLQELLKLYDGLELLEQPRETKYDVIKKQLSSYNDFYKTRRYRLALPTFNTDLAMKKLQITKVDDKEILSSEVILAIDYSASVGEHLIARSLIRSILLYYIDQMDKYPSVIITVVRVVGGVESTIKITEVKELQQLFCKRINFILPVRHTTCVFDDLAKLYPGRSIVFITDGKITLPKALNLNYKLYSITLLPNDNLKQTCLLSGGQYLNLNE